MKSFCIFILLATGCSYQHAPSFSSRETELEKSIFPIYFTFGSYFSDNPKERVLEPEYKACTAVYVTENIIVTSDTLFRNQTVELPRITVLDGAHERKVLDVKFNKNLGLAFVEMRESGKPIQLREKPIKANTPLNFVGYSFQRIYKWKARSVWEHGRVSVDSTWLENVGSEETYLAEMNINLGLCGAPVLDEQNHLSGIVHLKYGDSTASIISAEAIAVALREIENDQK